MEAIDYIILGIWSIGFFISSDAYREAMAARLS
jgi:hypothetical protein